MGTEIDIDFSSVLRLDNKFEELKDKYRQILSETAEEAGKMLKQNIDESIGSSGLNDAAGHIRSWQKARIGSRRGYAAISPVSGGTRGNNPGAITNYLQSGHKVRGPSGRAKRYKPRVKKMFVPGYSFYTSAGRRSESAAGALEKQAAAKMEAAAKELTTDA